ncbi:hypothetical protein [Nocardia pseudovaccinii]|uniref:hypothetical protein n=1 Tax=Nocardia pseudovaccinii TaxID=189540 RepID=UPI000B22B6D4|nr:hypothetical protein [Nocardia pseudovaccinii]
MTEFATPPPRRTDWAGLRRLARGGDPGVIVRLAQRLSEAVRRRRPSNGSAVPPL